MNKLTYVEKAYAVGYSGELERVITMADSRDPLTIPFETNLTYFRFFDAVSLNDTNSFENASDYSCKYYFGKRLSYKDLDPKDFFDGMHIGYLSKKGVDEAIFCESGMMFANIDSDDRTIEEVIIERVDSNSNRVFIEQGQFLEGIGYVLRIHGEEVSINADESKVRLPSIEHYRKTNSGNKDAVVPFIDYSLYDSQLIRTSELVVNGNSAISLDAIVNTDTDDAFFRFSNVEKDVRTLCQEFPYLERTIKNLKVAIYTYGDDVDVYGALTGNGKVTVKKTPEKK